MTTLFSDNFNRANGPIGNGWVDVLATWETLTNWARCVGATPGVALQPGFGSDPNTDTTLTILQASTASSYYGIIARSDLGFNNCYYLRYFWATQANGPYIEVWRKSAGVATKLYVIYNVPDSTADHILRLRCSGSLLSVYVDNNLLLNISDNTIAGGSYAGMYSNSTSARLDNFSVDSLPTTSLHVSPTTVPAGSLANILTLTSDAANWTPGTPGLPIFSCYIGVIAAQTVVDASTALLTYDAPGYVAVETIFDSLNGTQVDLGIGNVLPGDISEVLRRLGAYPIGQDSLTFLKSLAIEHPEGDENAQPQAFHDDLEAIGEQSTITAQVQSTWDVLTSYDPDVADVHATLAYLLGTSEKNRYVVINVLSQLLAIRTDGNHTLQDILDAIAAIPPADVQAVLDQLAAIRTPSDWTFGSVLQWIAQVQGNDTRNLTEIYDYLTIDLATVAADIFDSLAAYRTGSNYTVQSILDAIAAVQGVGAPDLAAILTAIAAVRGSGNPDIAAVLTALAGIQPTPSVTLDTLNGKLDTIYSYLTTHVPAIESTLQDILDAIAAIPGGPGSAAAPIYPGLGNFTLGTPVALDAQVTVDGPLHGIFVAVTTPPQKLGEFMIGGHHYDYRVGEVSFKSDRGDLEPFQYLGFRAAVYLPKSMKQAASAHLRVQGAAGGTATPFTIP